MKRKSNELMRNTFSIKGRGGSNVKSFGGIKFRKRGNQEKNQKVSTLHHKYTLQILRFELVLQP